MKLRLTQNVPHQLPLQRGPKTGTIDYQLSSPADPSNHTIRSPLRYVLLFKTKPPPIPLMSSTYPNYSIVCVLYVIEINFLFIDKVQITLSK